MKKKILVACLCVALAMLTIAGTTLAYLTSQDKVENTFTVGKVAITLDEAKVDNLGNPLNEAGKPVDDVKDAHRQKDNSYKLMPGHEYIKDPTVHVTAKSENSWIFVEVKNGISTFEAAKSAAYTPIADQITANGWTALDGVTDVYYREYTQNDAQVDYTVFSNFQMDDNANTVKGWDQISSSTTKVTVTAYAVQMDGFKTADDAWNATFGKTTTTNP